MIPYKSIFYNSPGHLVFSTQPQEHYFDCPYQLSSEVRTQTYLDAMVSYNLIGQFMFLFFHHSYHTWALITNIVLLPQHLFCSFYPLATKDFEKIKKKKKL